MKKSMVRSSKRKMEKRVREIVVKSKEELRDAEWKYGGKRRFLFRTDQAYFIKKETYEE